MRSAACLLMYGDPHAHPLEDYFARPYDHNSDGPTLSSPGRLPCRNMKLSSPDTAHEQLLVLLRFRLISQNANCELENFRRSFASEHKFYRHQHNNSGALIRLTLCRFGAS